MSPASIQPPVSVFMPVYNSAGFLDEAIQSIRDQSWRDFEFIIIDDGSSDASIDIIQQHASLDARIRLLRNEKNLGRPATRNRGLAEAKGGYIALMDADDRACTQRLERQKNYLEAHSDIDVVGSRWTPMNDSGERIKASARRRQLFSSDEIAARMLFECPVHQPTLMARADVLKRYRYDEAYPVAQDHELWSRMAPDCRFAVMDDDLLDYRQHASQAIAGREAILDGRHRIFARELAAIGIDHEPADLVRHSQLFHFRGRQLFERQFGCSLDSAFLKWSRAWMEQLVAANRRMGRYPEPEFSNYIAARWLFVCRKSMGSDIPARQILREFLASPLLRHIATAARHRALDPR